MDNIFGRAHHRPRSYTYEDIEEAYAKGVAAGLRRRRPAVKSAVAFHVRWVQEQGSAPPKIAKGEEMAQNLGDHQQFNLAVTFIDKAGNPATVSAPPTWTSSAVTVATVAAAADGMSAMITAVGALGPATITVSAVGDAGAIITGSYDIAVTAEGPSATNFVASPPTEQP